MNYTETLAWIHSYKANGRRPDLGRMKALLSLLGNPQNQFSAVHVVGTNGKGSTTSFLQHILTASGYKTGTFTSPFITRFNERIAIDGLEISDDDLVRIGEIIKPHLEDDNFLEQYAQVTEFELVTALMLIYFAKINPVDIAVIEAGIGGLWDSTNVFTAEAVICPSISLDHEETLGHSLTQIAQHKAGVLEESVPFIFGSMNKAVRQVFYNKAYNLDCPTYELGQDFSLADKGRTFNFISPEKRIFNISLAVLGQHQKANAALAAMTALLLAPLFPKINEQHIKKGLEETRWPGRCELIRPNLLLDGAHNRDSIAKLVALLKEEFSDRKIHILFAGLSRKPLADMLNLLSEFDLTVTSFDFPQAQALEDYPQDYSRVTDYQDWIRQAACSDDLYTVTGSLYFISEIRNYLT